MFAIVFMGIVMLQDNYLYRACWELSPSVVGRFLFFTGLLLLLGKPYLNVL